MWLENGCQLSTERGIEASPESTVQRKSDPSRRMNWGGKLWELYCVSELGIAGCPRTLQNMTYKCERHDVR